MRKKNIRFTKMSINIPGIIQWGDASNYVMPVIDNKESLIGLKIIEPIEIYSCKEYILSYDLTFSSPFFLMSEEINLKQLPYLIIEARLAQPLEWFMKIAKEMKRLIEIAMGTPLGFDSMVVESPEINYEFEDEKKHIRPLEVIHAFKQNIGKENKTNKMFKHDFLFNLSELRLGDFPKWQEVSTIMEPIIELYIDSLYNRELSVSRHFMNMD